MCSPFPRIKGPNRLATRGGCGVRLVDSFDEGALGSGPNYSPLSTCRESCFFYNNFRSWFREYINGNTGGYDEFNKQAVLYVGISKPEK